ncbi:HAD family hydrolase [Domibacillus epiphyticus]|uniref:Phosphoserine phosphatase n=1 Tax=Domibacillus epiphyticus TaxID=1714355 RepID=A0A1V2A4M2_9BACI|nr:HAD family hydrolase [Domibacillus epiphyticus]OMP65955.1 HAD family hydrolase [Domibacillus epiphyticus]
MKKAIFFDLDDTLLDDKKSIQTAFDITCGELAEKYSKDAACIEHHVRAAARAQYETYSFYPVTVSIGINPFEGLWGDFGDVHYKPFRDMGEQIADYQLKTWQNGLAAAEIPSLESEWARERFRNVRRESPFVYEETFDVLDKLREKGYRLLLLTNGAPSLQLEKLTMTAELVPYFEHILISGNFGFGKPEKAIFDHALKLINAAPDEVLMVGDNQGTDILGATRTGIQSVWIDHGEGKVIEGANPHHTIGRLQDILSLV